MNLRDIITLNDNNQYIVVGKIDYEAKTYYYLVDINKNENLKYCYQDNDELVELDAITIKNKSICICVYIYTRARTNPL